MILLEMRESKYNKAFDLLDEAHENISGAKAAICDLYQCIMDCYESDIVEPQYEEEYPEENYAEIDNVEIGEINYRRGMRDEDSMSEGHSNMRRRMRGAMRENMRGNMRSRMRRRMKRMGRYSY